MKLTLSEGNISISVPHSQHTMFLPTNKSVTS